jgi:hypothetical protein
VALVLWLWGSAGAQLSYDVATYKALADADSADTIPVGTKITLQNWKQYRKFMQIWMQQAYEGKYKWHVGSEPEYTVEVGPTHHFPMYKKFIEDTEKYGGQAQLVPLSTGGFSWKNYVAGIPCGAKPCGQAHLRHLGQFQAKNNGLSCLELVGRSIWQRDQPGKR